MQKDGDHEPTIGETTPETAPAPTESGLSDAKTDDVTDPAGELDDNNDGRSNVEGGLGATPIDTDPE